MKSWRRWWSFETRLFTLALAAGLPATAAVFILLYIGDYSIGVRWTLAVILLGCWFGFAAAVRERFAYSMRSLANLLGALREGDYSFRLRMPDRGSLGEVFEQVNLMAQTLHEQRLGAMEAEALLEKVITEIDVAIFAFDALGLLRLINRSGERLIAQGGEDALGQSAESLGLAPYLAGRTSAVTRAAFGSTGGLWSVRRGEFRESGHPHQLLVISDITRPLREEELHAWQRLVRVLGHEINNSLTPVKSLSASLADLIAREPLPDDWRDDMRSGLNVIANRVEALNRFTGAYARLARLPEPKPIPVQVEALVRQAARLETRLHVEIEDGPDVTVHVDPDQLGQLLINLVRNAADASLERAGSVRAGWRQGVRNLQIFIDDEGHGIANSTNLFVPFFTTKPGGSGIGLFLSRQIAEAHGGTVSLINRERGPGCRAIVTLPL